MRKLKAIYKTIKFVYYGVPLLWQIKMGRLYVLRDSPDWLVTDLAHSGGFSRRRHRFELHPYPRIVHVCRIDGELALLMLGIPESYDPAEIVGEWYPASPPAED